MAKSVAAHTVARARSISGPVYRADAEFHRGGVGPDTTGTIAYNSILTNGSGQTSSYIASEGFECCTVDEFGDSLVLTQGGRLKTIEVILDSWGCQTGDGYGYTTCQTTHGATFAWPITINVYSMTGYPSGSPQVGTLLASQTHTFNIKYRPSSNSHCNNTALGAFIGPVDKMCDYGIAVPITFNMRLPAVTVPNQIIVTLAYNTSNSGYNPVGDNTPCRQNNDCGYDSLNVSAWGNGGVDNGVGSVADSNGAMVNFTNAGFYCGSNPNGQPPGGTLVDDTSSNPCWSGYHPEIKVTLY